MQVSSAVPTQFILTRAVATDLAGIGIGECLNAAAVVAHTVCECVPNNLVGSADVEARTALTSGNTVTVVDVEFDFRKLPTQHLNELVVVARMPVGLALRGHAVTGRYRCTLELESGVTNHHTSMAHLYSHLLQQLQTLSGSL